MTLLTYLKLDTAGFEAGIGRASATLGTVGNAMDSAAQSAGGMAQSVSQASSPAPLEALARSARDAGAALEEASRQGRTLAGVIDMVQIGTRNGVPVYGTPGDKQPEEQLKKVKPAADSAMQGLNALSAVSGLTSGTLQGTASGAIALAGALKGIGVAAATSIAAFAAIAAALVIAAKRYLETGSAAAKLNKEIELGNARSGVDNLASSFEKMRDSIGGAVAHMRDLRALTREGQGVETEKRLAGIELERKRELAALTPDDEKGARAVNRRYDRMRSLAELEGEEQANTAEAAERRRQREENTAAIAQRREQLEQLEAARQAAWKNQRDALTSDPGFWATFRGFLPGGESPEAAKEQEAAGWSSIAKTADDEARRIRKEVEELERKNQVLEEQARLYERRNEVVAIKRQAAGIDEPEKKDKEKPKSSPLNVPTDRLTRIGGITAGGFGASPGGNVADKQLAETREMRRLLERIARREPGLILG